MQDLSPRQIVTELDRFIIGQTAAKKAVAIAIRNRWRRQKLDPAMAGEVYPKNIILIGPTGVGKTEIARRLATMTGAPFIKVEASKFTEVGYHGRDVESMVRDLLDQAISTVRAEQSKAVADKAAAAVNEDLLDLLLPGSRAADTGEDASEAGAEGETSAAEPGGVGAATDTRSHTREKLAGQLAAGKLDSRDVEISVSQRPATSVMFANMGLEQMDPDMANMFERLIPEQNKRRKVTIAEARRILTEQETDKLLDKDKITAEAITRTQDSGIIFLDEIDKIASPGGEGRGGGSGGGGPDVSRQGVQRDLLPIVEGSTVNTRHGIVHTGHILFIAAGAFHSAAVSDLMPELQGRFPIRVELSSLNRDDFVRILTEPRNALTKQQQQLLGVEGLDIQFERSAIEAMADVAANANATMENIGARRLMTIIEKVFEEINFNAPEMASRGETKINITADFVNKQVGSLLKDQNLNRFVL